MASGTSVQASVQPDFVVQNEGTIYILHPHSQAAYEWIFQNLPADAQRWAGGVVIEHRYIGDILFGIENDGLVVIQ